MARVDDYLELVEDAEHNGLVYGHSADDALLALLVAVASADGEISDEEVGLLGRVLPDRDPEALREWAARAAREPLDVALLAEILSTPEERWSALRFAARMALRDLRLAPAETALLERLVAAFQLPGDALTQVLGELRGGALTDVSPTKVRQALASMTWRSVQHHVGGLEGDLAEVVPETTHACCRVAVDGVEFLGFTEEGFAGRFREGTAFLPWSDLVSFTRVSTLGTAVQILTEDGRRWTLVDPRLRGLVTFLERLQEPEPPVEEPEEPVVVHKLRGD